MKVKCQDCAFWVVGEEGDTGTCHRHAPRPFLPSYDDEEAEERESDCYIWPTVFVWGWCGEFKKRSKK